MSEEKTTTNGGTPITPPQEETYEIVFRNGALKNLKTVAKDLGVPETDLKQVVNKSINLLTLVKGGKFLILEDDKGNRYRVDMNKL